MLCKNAKTASVYVLISTLMSSAAAHQSVRAEGRALAVQACSACHQVTEQQPRPAPVLDPDTLEHVEAPSFTTIARKYSNNTKALRAFIQAPDHPMREQQFLPRDVEAIVAYIRSLSPRH